MPEYEKVTVLSEPAGRVLVYALEDSGEMDTRYSSQGLDSGLASDNGWTNGADLVGCLDTKMTCDRRIASLTTIFSGTADGA